ncbi:MAG TPA: nucleoside phosphorylase [Elusimicrobiales bacterium]|nr:nucleoside phosphorylase [Elusimicrobiales bacterium]
MEKLIGLTQKDVAETVFICGDPRRVKDLAAHLDSPKYVAENREYVSWSGSFDGKRALVVSHGVGAAGAGVCVQELIDLGARKIVRIGTAGTFLDDYKRGDVFLPSGTLRMDGTTRRLVEPEYPAVPDFSLLSAIYSSVKAIDPRVKCGLSATDDLFYAGEEKFKAYKKLNIDAVDMETSVLYVLGSLNRVKTASALFFDGNPIKWNNGDYDPKSTVLKDSMARIVPAVMGATISLP